LAKFNWEVEFFYDLCEVWLLRFLLIADPNPQDVRSLFDDYDLDQLIRLEPSPEKEDAFKNRSKNRWNFRERPSEIEPQRLPRDKILARNIKVFPARLSASPLEQTVLAFAVLLHCVEPFYKSFRTSRRVTTQRDLQPVALLP
jgi:hypothetical protein